MLWIQLGLVADDPARPIAIDYLLMPIILYAVGEKLAPCKLWYPLLLYLVRLPLQSTWHNVSRANGV
jgi:hypothetical protein